LWLQGRPKGENKEEDKKKYSLGPVADCLRENLGGVKVSLSAMVIWDSSPG
jgi:3-phosphoglycerate kinase